ncbi:hypothetical protein NUW54_g8690 [Trametes sanguinea]|uniref:Uncharacterized protein n=1 Tax=Trametes sanguinea TaxID=158606 RepID=A0ACC1PCH3_9APHY|nr:hypothetical protein NUW54_g8690 [Trametes sanguinea]
MARQVFALIIGIDNYESNDIWNLHSAAKDARRIEQWLVRDFQVPRSHICRLLDHQATKRNIEDIFMTHLVNNPAIEPGDALVVYFAGHGGSYGAVAPEYGYPGPGASGPPPTSGANLTRIQLAPLRVGGGSSPPGSSAGPGSASGPGAERMAGGGGMGKKNPLSIGNIISDDSA